MNNQGQPRPQEENEQQLNRVQHDAQQLTTHITGLYLGNAPLVAPDLVQHQPARAPEEINAFLRNLRVTMLKSIGVFSTHYTHGEVAAAYNKARFVPDRYKTALQAYKEAQAAVLHLEAEMARYTPFLELFPKYKAAYKTKAATKSVSEAVTNATNKAANKAVKRSRVVEIREANPDSDSDDDDEMANE